MSACPPCLRRAWLLAAVSGRLETAFRGRDALRDVLALEDEALIAAVAPRGGDDLRVRRERFDVVAARAACARAGLRTTGPHDAAFPRALAGMPGGPRALFVAGDPERLRAWVPPADGGGTDAPPAVAIVGTRRASAEALEMARSLGRGLAAAGVTVVSGMALGVDSAAHAGALEVGGPTVAVLAGGADVAYPRSKAALHARLVAGAVVVSELPPGTQPLRWCFPARNRTIAGLATCTVVVEAAERSGSLITADFAQALGRDVGVVPGRATSPRTRGSNGLLREGAHVVLGVEDVLDLVGAPRPAAGGQLALLTTALPADVAGAARALLQRIAAGEASLDDLARTPDEADAALEALAELEAVGAVRRAPGGRYVLSGPTYPRTP